MTTYSQLVSGIANAIKRYYNRHGIFMYSSYHPYSGVLTSLPVRIALTGKFTPDIVLTFPPEPFNTEIGAEYQTIRMTSTAVDGPMITKIRDAEASLSLVGEIKIVSDRVKNITIVIKVKKVGEKISCRTVSVDAVD